MRGSLIDVHIRSAELADLPRVLALLSENGLPTGGVADLLPGFLVAQSGDRIVGVAGLESCSPEYALLRSVAVDHSWRGRGLGGQLVDRIIASARSSRLKALYLLTTTAESYFPGFGFTSVTRDSVPYEIRASHEFSTACPASAAVMVLSLEHDS